MAGDSVVIIHKKLYSYYKWMNIKTGMSPPEYDETHQNVPDDARYRHGDVGHGKRPEDNRINPGTIY